MRKIVNEQTGNRYKTVYSLLVVLFGLLSTVLCLSLNIGEKRIIAILPLTYVILYALFKNNRKYLNNISLSIINISAFCRYIIYPMIIAETLNRGEYYNFSTNTVYLLAYELIGVFCVIGFFSKKLDKSTCTDVDANVNLGVPNLLLVALIFPILALFPSLLTRFSVSSSVVKSASTSGIVEILFTMGLWVLFVNLILRLSKLKDGSRLTNRVGFVLAVLVGVYYVMFNSISGDDVKRWQIISCGVAMIYILILAFPAKKRLILVGGIVGILFYVMIGSLIKFGLLGSSVSFVDKFFDIGHYSDYFGGMKNITEALEIFDSSPRAQGLQSTLTDLFSGVPVFSSFFDFGNYSTISIFQNAVQRTDIICPLTAQSVAHFGVVGTPVLAMIMTYLAIVFNSALKKTGNLYSAYVLIELVVFTSLFMELNTTIILGKIWIRLMFLLLQLIEARTKLKFVIRKEV